MTINQMTLKEFLLEKKLGNLKSYFDTPIEKHTLLPISPIHNDEFIEHSKKFSDKHHRVIRDYKEELNEPINDYLRNGTLDNHQIIKKIKILDQITSHSLKRPLDLYRGYNSPVFSNNRSEFHKYSNLKPGKILHDKGFTSTSLSPDIAYNNGEFLVKKNKYIPSIDYDDDLTKDTNIKNIFFHIHAPKGTNAYFLDHHKHFLNWEQEVLLRRGTHFKVLGHSVHPYKLANGDSALVHVVHMKVHKQDNIWK